MHSAPARIGGRPTRVYEWSVDHSYLLVDVLPMMRRDAAIICRSRNPAAGVRACRQIGAATSVLRTATSIAPGPDRQLSRSVDAASRRMSALRRSVAGVQSAPLSSKGLAVGALAHGERLLAAKLEKLSRPARYRTPLSGLASALRREAAVLTVLALAGRAGDIHAYNIALKQSDAADRRVASALQRLRPFKLAIGGLVALHLRKVPLPIAPPATTPSAPPVIPSRPTTTQPTAPTYTAPAHPTTPTTTTFTPLR
jgi:hypothetical protein